MASSPECITWMVVGLTESVTKIALNSLTVIAFCRDRNLCKRSTYLVISLAVADMLSGGISPVYLFYNVGVMCNFWRYNSKHWHKIPVVLIIWFLVCSLTNMTVIPIERLNATFWPFRHRMIKKSVYWVLIIAIWLTALLFSCALEMMIYYRREWDYYLFGHLCFLRLYCCQVSPALFRLYSVSIFLLYANSFLNPMLYTMRMPGFRRALKMLCRQRPQTHRQVEIIPLPEINSQT
ncbi:D(3) dopamine receptor-like [Pocillopora verrucosa]|uniref:D(3) dopamine receptor-like n=1 Tax=Pocillopora verrucosa TaxID=203993 RepID=UPI00333FEF19